MIVTLFHNETSRSSRRYVQFSGPRLSWWYRFQKDRRPSIREQVSMAKHDEADIDVARALCRDQFLSHEALRVAVPRTSLLMRRHLGISTWFPFSIAGPDLRLLHPNKKKQLFYVTSSFSEAHFLMLWRYCRFGHENSESTVIADLRRPRKRNQRERLTTTTVFFSCTESFLCV